MQAGQKKLGRHTQRYAAPDNANSVSGRVGLAPPHFPQVTQAIPCARWRGQVGGLVLRSELLRRVASPPYALSA